MMNYSNNDPLKHTIHEILDKDISHCYHDGDYLYVEELNEEFPDVEFDGHHIYSAKHRNSGKIVPVIHEDDFLRDMVKKYEYLTDDVIFMLKSYMKYGYFLDDDAIETAWGVLNSIDSNLEEITNMDDVDANQLIEAWESMPDLDEFEYEKKEYDKKKKKLRIKNKRIR